eukprot:scaffold1439_cov404-Prasinococcus_capsulatus_cf.AAC.72
MLCHGGSRSAATDPLSLTGLSIRGNDRIYCCDLRVPLPIQWLLDPASQLPQNTWAEDAVDPKGQPHPTYRYTWGAQLGESQ